MHSLAGLRAERGPIAMPARSGETLFLEGDPSDYVYELRRGIARGVNIGREGDRQVTAFFFAGDQIGLPVSDLYRFTAEAVTDVLYFRHARGVWHEKLIRSCREEGRLLPAIGAEQNPIFHRSIILGRNSVLARLCSFLAAIVDRLPFDEDGARLLSLPQVDIAAYLAISPESVCRALRRLREMEAIDMPRHDRIAIIARHRIEAMAHGGQTGI